MEVRINRQVLNAILVDHGASREGVEGLRIEIVEEPHLIPKDRNIIIKALKRLVAIFFHLPLGVYVPKDKDIFVYKTRIELSLYRLNDVLAHECGHFLDNNLGKKPLAEVLPSYLAFCKDLCKDWAADKEWIAAEIAKVLTEDPRWRKVFELESLES